MKDRIFYRILNKKTGNYFRCSGSSCWNEKNKKHALVVLKRRLQMQYSWWEVVLIKFSAFNIPVKYYYINDKLVEEKDIDTELVELLFF